MVEETQDRGRRRRSKAASTERKRRQPIATSGGAEVPNPYGDVPLHLLVEQHDEYDWYYPEEEARKRIASGDYDWQDFLLIEDIAWMTLVSNGGLPEAIRDAINELRWGDGPLPSNDEIEAAIVEKQGEIEERERKAEEARLERERKEKEEAERKEREAEEARKEHERRKAEDPHYDSPWREAIDEVKTPEDVEMEEADARLYEIYSAARDGGYIPELDWNDLVLCSDRRFERIVEVLGTAEWIDEGDGGYWDGGCFEPDQLTRLRSERLRERFRRDSNMITAAQSNLSATALTPSMLEDIDDDDPDFLVEGIPAVGVTILSGPAGAFKSTLVTDLAAALSSGRTDALGFEKAGPAAAMVLNNEQSSKAILRAYRAAAAVHGLEDGKAFLPLGNENGTKRLMQGDLPNAVLIESLKEMVQAHDVKLLVLDTLTSLGLTSDIDNIAGHELIDMLNGLASQLQIAILVVHHPPGKDNADIGGSMASQRGATAMFNAAASNLTLQRTLPDAARGSTTRARKLDSDIRDAQSRGDEQAYVELQGALRRSTSSPAGTRSAAKLRRRSSARAASVRAGMRAS